MAVQSAFDPGSHLGRQTARVSMKLNRIATCAGLGLALALVLHEVAQACNPYPSIIEIRCNGQVISFPDWSLEERQPGLIEAAVVCGEETALVASELDDLMTAWSRSRRSYLDGNMIIEPYSPQAEMAIQSRQRDLLSCRLDTFTRLGNWLIVTETHRPYCDTNQLITLCPTVVFSISGFASYLLANPSPMGGAYLFVLLVVCAVMVASFYQFAKKRRTSMGWLTIQTLVLLPVVLFLNFIQVFMIGQIAGLTLWAFIIAQWIVKLKNWRGSQTKVSIV
jgi:hypothetical protein